MTLVLYLAFFTRMKKKALKDFVEFINQENDDKCMDVSEKIRISDSNAVEIIKEYCGVKDAEDIQEFDINKRNLYLKNLMKIKGLSIRQIERLTGIGRGVIQRATR